MTSLIPMYHDKIYKQDPIFQDARMVYSVYDGSYSSTFTPDFFDKAKINDLSDEDLSAYKDGDKITLHEGAINYADALIIGSEITDESVQRSIDASSLPKVKHEEEEFLANYLDFYKTLTSE